jgi:hypothetical protein
MWQLGNRAVHLIRTEGVPGLLSGARGWLSSLRRSIVTAEEYVIYQFDTDTSQRPELRPDIKGLEITVLESEEDMDRLAAHGYEVVESHPSFNRKWLRRGAVAFCAHVNRELAHVGWVAMSEAARGCCDSLPYHVDFEHGEANWGGAYTWRRFRNMGIYAYVCGIRLNYMRAKGYGVCRDAVRRDNAASLRGQGWWHPRPCLSGRYVRFLRWRRWTETTVDGVPG